MNDIAKRVTEIGERAMATGRGKSPAKKADPQGSPVQMPLWTSSLRAMPNALIRSALFNVTNQNVERVTLKKAKLASIEGIELHYTGEDLRQDESDVMLELFHMARNTVLSERMEFSGYGILKQLGWGNSAKAYTRLVKILERLQAGQLTITFNGNRKGFTGSLVRKFYWNDGTSTGTDGKTHWVVYLEPEMIQLFGGDDYTRLSIEQRQQLRRELSKWLHSYFHSHSAPYAHSVAFIHRMCGSQAKELYHFRTTLRMALKELVSVGFISDWHIDKNDLVHVVRANLRQAAIA